MVQSKSKRSKKMKGILEFRLPEENKEFLTASIAGQMLSVISNLETEARRKLKYGHEMTADEILEWVREETKEIIFLQFEGFI